MMNINEIIPTEILYLIMTNRDLPDLVKSREVCKLWRDIFDTNLNFSHFDRPVNKTFVAKLFVSEYLALAKKYMFSLVAESSAESPGECHDHESKLNRYMKVLEDGMSPESVAFMTENFSLEQLVTVIKLNQCPAVQNWVFLKHRIQMRMSNLDQIEEDHEKSSIEDTDYARQMEIAGMVINYLSIKGVDVERASIPFHDFIPSICKSFSVMELSEMEQVLLNPAMKVLVRIVNVFERIGSQLTCPVEDAA